MGFRHHQLVCSSIFSWCTVQHLQLVCFSIDEWLVLWRDLYLTTHDTHKKHTSMCPAGFEPTISACKRPQIDDLDRTANGTGTIEMYFPLIDISLLHTQWQLLLKCNALDWSLSAATVVYHFVFLVLCNQHTNNDRDPLSTHINILISFKIFKKRDFVARC
jgi:hypothetical protein